MTGEPALYAAALLLRSDGRLLLVQLPAAHRDFGRRWALPMDAIAADEVAEAAVARLLRERLHVDPGSVEFADTLYFAGAAGGRYVANVFTCEAWGGDPRFADEHYADAAWIKPPAPASLDVLPELRRWLTGEFSEGGADRETLLGELAAARRELLSAFEAIASSEREQPLQAERSPLDVLVLAASEEVYLAAETRRLLEAPGHSWRDFSEAQWEDDQLTRPHEHEGAVRSRLAAVAQRTDEWLGELPADRLMAYGNHPQRGVVTVADRVGKIARRHRELAQALQAMAQAARVQVAGERAGGGGA
ncbi:MAG: NUDIX domain-containing protein [Dehalococcoidia bacterium]|nr:NUDIX domain-containing protein [Dehalococcoidia bacterium]